MKNKKEKILLLILFLIVITIVSAKQFTFHNYNLNVSGNISIGGYYKFDSGVWFNETNVTKWEEGDNLGDHIATQDIDVNENDIVNVVEVSSSSGSYIEFKSNGDIINWI